MISVYELFLSSKSILIVLVSVWFLIVFEGTLLGCSKILVYCQNIEKISPAFPHITLIHLSHK